MAYQLSVWLDNDTAEALAMLSVSEERRRGDVVRVLIRRAARELKIVMPEKQNRQVVRGEKLSND